MIDRDSEMLRGNRIRDLLWPLDRDDGVAREQLIKADRLKIFRADAPRVDMNERTCFTRVIHADCEGRTRDRIRISAKTGCKAA